jgi:hypothetical protein
MFDSSSKTDDTATWSQKPRNSLKIRDIYWLYIGKQQKRKYFFLLFAYVNNSDPIS